MLHEEENSSYTKITRPLLANIHQRKDKLFEVNYTAPSQEMHSYVVQVFVPLSGGYCQEIYAAKSHGNFSPNFSLYPTSSDHVAEFVWSVFLNR